MRYCIDHHQHYLQALWIGFYFNCKKSLLLNPARDFFQIYPAPARNKLIKNDEITIAWKINVNVNVVFGIHQVNWRTERKKQHFHYCYRKRDLFQKPRRVIKTQTKKKAVWRQMISPAFCIRCLCKYQLFFF